jgi:hypothetical protein
MKRRSVIMRFGEKEGWRIGEILFFGLLCDDALRSLEESWAEVAARVSPRLHLFPLKS